MTKILLVGGELPLLEGLVQAFSSAGFTTQVAATLAEARDVANAEPPLVAIVSRPLAAAAGTDMLSIPLAAGGALLLYRAIGSMLVTLSPTVQRTVLADLTLPLERNRLLALIHHVGDRARATGRDATTARSLAADDSRGYRLQDLA